MPLGVHLGYPGFHLERPHRVRDAPADYPDRTRAINDDLTADFNHKLGERLFGSRFPPRKVRVRYFFRPVTGSRPT